MRSCAVGTFTAAAGTTCRSFGNITPVPVGVDAALSVPLTAVVAGTTTIGVCVAAAGLGSRGACCG